MFKIYKIHKFNDFMYVDDDINSKCPTDEDIVELYKCESEPVQLDNDSESDTVQDDLQQSPSSLLQISYTFCLAIKNQYTYNPNSLYNSLNNIEAFLKFKIKFFSLLANITIYYYSLVKVYIRVYIKVLM